MADDRRFCDQETAVAIRWEWRVCVCVCVCEFVTKRQLWLSGGKGGRVCVCVREIL